MPDPITVVMGENNGFLGGDCAIVMGALRVSGALLIVLEETSGQR